ncbi:MAG: hypothetical protein KAG18_07445 [Sinobacterium sp.]|nr:hypothetical protein [Sinobacterium sp.]
MNVLIILGVLFTALIILLPILEKTSKPVDDEKMGQYSKIMMGLMLGLVMATSIKFCMGS